MFRLDLPIDDRYLSKKDVDRLKKLAEQNEISVRRMCSKLLRFFAQGVVDENK